MNNVDLIRFVYDSFSKGDAASVPINAEARKIVDAWDPAKEEAAGTDRSVRYDGLRVFSVSLINLMIQQPYVCSP